MRKARPVLDAANHSDRNLQRIIFVVTGTVFTFFHLGGALGHNAATILATRMLAGTFGAARTSLHTPSNRHGSDAQGPALTNAGGAISDMWAPRERGFAASLYGTAPWMGPGMSSLMYTSFGPHQPHCSHWPDRGWIRC